MRTKLLLLALLFPAQYLLCQDGRQYSFTHYSVSNGLAAYNTYSIAQDDQGYVWIGTGNGLQRFDGSRFLTFRHNPADKNSLPVNYISQILVDKQKNLWLVFGNGMIGIFDTRRFIFKPIKMRLKDPKNLTFGGGLMQDGDGNLFYYFSFKEFVTYNRERNEFSSEYNVFTIPAKWRITNLTDDPIGKKYIIATDSGLVVYNRITKKMSWRDNNTEHEPLIEQFGKIQFVAGYMVDKKGRYWFMNWPPYSGCGIYCYDLVNNTPVLDKYSIDKVVNKYNEPAGMIEQKDGTIWLTGLYVFARYEEAENKFIPVYNGYLNEQSIQYDGVRLFEDREQNLWVGTNNNGLYVFNPSKEIFKSVGHLNRINLQNGSGGAMSFARTNNGDILAGYWGDGLYRYDSSFRNIKLGIQGIDEVNAWSIWDMCRLKDNRKICMVGQPAFIAFYDQATETLKRYEPAIFETRTIAQVVEDKKGNLWFGSYNRGVYKWSATKGAKSFEAGLYKLNSIPNNRVLNLIADSKGFIWVGTLSAGVYKIDPADDRIIEHITDSGAVTKKLIANGAAMLEYNDSLMIIAGGGLNFYDTKNNNIRHITTADGLPSDLIVSLEKDKAGYLWIGMSTGLCRMNIHKNTFTFYDRSEGMANDNFEISTNYQLPDGRMVFGSSNDFVVFNPQNIKSTATPPDVSITGFKVVNNSLSVDSLMKLDKIDLLANENSITISYSVLSYFNKNKLVYYYMLEGIDKEWKKGNELNEAIYNYLPAATYTFKIRSENGDGVPSKNITTIKIKISPPFWKSWWFYGLLTITCIVVFYLADRERLLRFKATQKLRTDIALNLHHDVNTALGNINLMSEMARMKADKDITMSKELIEQISNKSNDMMIAMDDILWVIDPANDSMEKTLLRMWEFIDALRNRHEAEIEMHVDGKVKDIKLDMKERHSFFFIFKKALRCLVQYSGARQTLINIDIQQDRLCLKMHGTTAITNTDSNTFQCIEEMKEHADSINAELDVEDVKGNGNIVLLMPVK